MKPGFGILFFVVSLAAQGANVVLKEDSFILPPLLSRVEIHPKGTPDGINIEANGGKKRRIVPGGWFDPGDRFRIPAPFAVEVVQNEFAVWVAGGVFQGKIGVRETVESSAVQSTIAMERGWMKVWAKPGQGAFPVAVEANRDSFVATDAEFWIHARDGVTELYVVRGEVFSLQRKRTFAGKVFAMLKKQRDAPVRLSSDWDASAIEVRIAGAYPALVRLAEAAGSRWNQNRFEEIYSDFRKRGGPKIAK